MGRASADTLRLRALIDEHRPELDAALAEYGAINPRLFGSVARGDAGPNSDIDILVDFAEIPANTSKGKPRSSLFRAGGLNSLFVEILGIDVDLFSADLLKSPLSQSVIKEAVAL